MIDRDVIETLSAFDFTSCRLPTREAGVLIRSVRMNCNYCPPQFDLTRDDNYPYFTLHIVFSGQCLFQIGGREYRLKQGDVFLITAGQKHHYANDHDSNLGFLWIELAGKGCKDLLRYLALNGIHCIRAPYTDKMIHQLVQILQYVKEASATQQYNLFTLSAMEYALIMDLLESAEAQPKQTLSPMVAHALDHIDATFTGAVRVQQIAEQLHVSHTYFTRQFKAELGISPVQYLAKKRVEYACLLLEQTTLSCAEIAMETGFYDATHFHRAFRKQMDCTPLHYRQNKQEKASSNRWAELPLHL